MYVSDIKTVKRSTYLLIILENNLKVNPSLKKEHPTSVFCVLFQVNLVLQESCFSILCKASGGGGDDKIWGTKREDHELQGFFGVPPGSDGTCASCLQSTLSEHSAHHTILASNIFSSLALC